MAGQGLKMMGQLVDRVVIGVSRSRIRSVSPLGPENTDISGFDPILRDRNSPS
jgi:hypothetical protein